MVDLDDKANTWDVEWLQDQVYQLQNTVRDLESTIERIQMEITLLTNDLNTIKTEGCWRFVEDPKHSHRRNDE